MYEAINQDIIFNSDKKYLVLTMSIYSLVRAYLLKHIQSYSLLVKGSELSDLANSESLSRNLSNTLIKGVFSENRECKIFSHRSGRKV